MLVRLVAVLAVVVVAHGVAFPQAAPGGRHGGRPDVDVWVPIDPSQPPPPTTWMHPKDRRLIPPTVSIDHDPYVCDLDDERFPDREAFAAHLRAVHLVAPDRIPGLLYELDGDVHFVGE